MPVDPATERFELPIAVLPADIDELGHVNNVVYLRWVQDAAVAHWQAAATEAQQATLAWVAVRHEIDYKYPAMPGEQLVARTWVGRSEKSSFERHTEILRGSDRRLLARARTLWCPISRATGKPTKVDESVRARFSTAAM
ncbi:MAG: thioesterase family protein [Gemmatimonadota bacterium]